MNLYPTIGMLGWPEIVGIAVIVLVLFGAKKVPELMRGLGHGIKEFKKATRDIQEDLQRSIEDEPPARRTYVPEESVAKEDHPVPHADAPPVEEHPSAEPPQSTDASSAPAEEVKPANALKTPHA